MNRPRVTVVMNVHNGERYLRPAIQSVLDQSLVDWELIVVDDGSSDRSAEIVLAYSDPRVHLVRNRSQMGIPQSINRGIALARGELIAHQDADDVSYPSRLEKQVRFMDAHPEVAGIGTRFSFVNERGQAIRFWPGALPLPVTPLGIRWALLFGGGFQHSSIMVRRAIAWDELGGYDENCPRAQDYEFWSRLAFGHTVLNSSERLVGYRSHSSSNTRRHPISTETSERLLRRSMRQILESDQVPDGDWVHHYVCLVQSAGCLPHKVACDLIAGLHTIHARFGLVYPKAVALPEIRQQYAFQLAVLGCHLARKSCPTESFWAYREALRVDWRTALLIMPKYFAFLSMGDQARRLWHRLTHT